MDDTGKQQGNKPLLIILGILVICLLGLGIYYFFLQQKNQKPTTTQNTSGNTYDYDNTKRAADVIFIKSAVYGYEPVFTNKPGIVDLIKKWGIYGREYVKGNKVQKVTIILTTTPFYNYILDNGKGEMISSDSVNFYTGEMNILVYVNPKFTQSNPTAFEDGALFALFSFGNASDKPTIETKKQDFDKFLQEKHAKNQTYIKLKKF